MKHNPDDRRNNVDRIQKNISNIIENMEAADELISITDDEQKKKNLEEKNIRRKKALNGLRKEIKDEAIDKERGYE